MFLTLHDTRLTTRGRRGFIVFLTASCQGAREAQFLAFVAVHDQRSWVLLSTEPQTALFLVPRHASVLFPATSAFDFGERSELRRSVYRGSRMSALRRDQTQSEALACFFEHLCMLRVPARPDGFVSSMWRLARLVRSRSTTGCREPRRGRTPPSWQGVLLPRIHKQRPVSQRRGVWTYDVCPCNRRN